MTGANSLAQGSGCKDTLAIESQFASPMGSTYVPLDSWIYSAIDRLHGLGYADQAYLGMRPWTRMSIVHMLAETADKIADANDDEACTIFHSLQREMEPDVEDWNGSREPRTKLESVYTRLSGTAGTPLRDSFHLGQTFVNDYGRPYHEGFNNITGFSTRSSAGRFSLYFRGEYQHAPGAPGYNNALSTLLSNNDLISFTDHPNQATIPSGPIPAANNFRIVEANVSYLLLNHQFSFGKSDHWLSPAQGGSFAWSNNAENIYAFQIDRVEPLYIPLLSQITGPFRYQFSVGSLKGHTTPNAPWMHVEKLSFKPTENLELGFGRTVIWGGQRHVPITFGTFFRSFFHMTNVSAEEKFSRNDPGARFSFFDFSYRVPFARNWLTLYSDSFAHDDVNPISAPRRAAIRPGIYLSHFPGLKQLDFRAEAASTDPPTSRSNSGAFIYAEAVQLQGYTNKGSILGDWIGRESKGGQAWLTYHLSPEEQVQVSWRGAKAAKDFIPGGTTQNIFQVSAIKRFHKDFEVRGLFQHEQWKAPVYKPGGQSDTSVSMQITWLPKSIK
ncbi:capsule assembly Wzi family protein [Edaphobacter albus]|uniref:capsule assembly Wzi family protein n=1 Tax=Edaphobacter sp. 4G125 TaxID=2763071 RepID=UPI001647B888|nr:capsule assembly Wzi family protein [Edaphobacter sp. 4G125]QNI36941.1 capsule assembly Wzi family protein [Edaphobacter sp. 4G125]